MTTDQFFSLYANTPLDKRFQVINYALFGTMTLNQAYQRISELEDKIRPFVIEETKIMNEIERLNLLPTPTKDNK